MRTFKTYTWTLLFIGLATAVIIGCIAYKHHQTRDAYLNSITLILSPHFDDAVLSAGGLMAKNDHPSVVATFFTATPEVATTTSWDQISGFKNSTEAMISRIKENAAALKILGTESKNLDYFDNQYGRGESDEQAEADIARDIQTLLASYHGKTINVYGPAIFTPTITHPDHGLLHKAFLDVASQYPGTNVHFYMYEDFPYTEHFNKESVVSLKKNLELDSGSYLDQENVLLTSAQVNKKIEALTKYTSQTKAFTADTIDILTQSRNFTSTRCGIDPAQACEVFYKLH